MALTLTANDIHFDDGVYQASIIGIEQRESAVAGARDGCYLRWKFQVYRPNEKPVELIANSSSNFGRKSKAREWVEAALDRKLDPGETIEPERHFPLRCQVIIEMDSESGFARIVKVLRANPNAAKAPQESQAPPLSLTGDSDSDDDIPF